MAAVEASHYEEQGKEGIMLSSFSRRLYRWLTRIAGRSVRSNMQLMRFNRHSPRFEIDWTPSATRLSVSYWALRQIHGPAAHRRLSTEGLGRLKPKGAMDRRRTGRLTCEDGSAGRRGGPRAKMPHPERNGEGWEGTGQGEGSSADCAPGVGGPQRTG